MNYCTICGKKLIKDSLIGFDKNTGIEKFKKVCPSGECNHVGIEHKWDRERRLLGRKPKCKKCGEKRYYD